MASIEQVLNTRTVTIDTNLASKEGYLVSFDSTDDDVVNIAVVNDKVSFPLGSDGDGSTTPTTGTIIIDGCVKVKLGGTVAAGDRLRPDANGKAIVATAGLTYSLIALNKGVDGDLVVCKVAHGAIPA